MYTLRRIRYPGHTPESQAGDVRIPTEIVAKIERPDGRDLSPTRAHSLIGMRFHNFDFGGRLPGANLLAAAVLLDHGIDRETVLQLYEKFAAEVVATLPPVASTGECTLAVADINQWLSTQLP